MTSPPPSRYVAISPVRDEAKNFPHTIASLEKQTVRPERWIIVDDGSRDGTGGIADAAAAKHSWITVMHRKDRGFRKTGGGVIEAFNTGYELVRDQEWEVVAKLDADLSFESDYFEKCLGKFRDDPKLGIGGGLVREFREGKLVVGSPGDPAFHVRGATKLYRRECLEQIGPLQQTLGWDTLDEVKANMLGWRTYTFRDLNVTHYKITGSADGSWAHWIKLGQSNYAAGYHPVFMACKCVIRLKSRPYGLVALAVLLGYLSGYFGKVRQVDDRALVRWIRQQQIRRLLFRSSIWK